MDEPESLGAISVAGREKLVNLIFHLCHISLLIVSTREQET
jgi:pyruvate dehydrogenase complex dehydrogenase (E1) component